MLLLEALPTIIGAAAIAPALLMLWLVIAADERPGPPAQVWIAFLFGAGRVMPADAPHQPDRKSDRAESDQHASRSQHQPG